MILQALVVVQCLSPHLIAVMIVHQCDDPYSDNNEKQKSHHDTSYDSSCCSDSCNLAVFLSLLYTILPKTQDILQDFLQNKSLLMAFPSCSREKVHSVSYRANQKSSS